MGRFIVTRPNYGPPPIFSFVISLSTILAFEQYTVTTMMQMTHLKCSILESSEVIEVIGLSCENK